MRTLTAEQNLAQNDWLSTSHHGGRLKKVDERLPAVILQKPSGPFDAKQLRFARCRAATFFRAVGLEDPDVLAAASQHAVRVAVRSLRDRTASSAVARLPQATIATADAMRRRTIRRLDAALPGVGGASRRGELSMRLAAVLAARPECLLEGRFAAEVIRLARGDEVQGLEMPTEEPVRFPPQSLVDTRPHPLRAICHGLLQCWRRRLVHFFSA